MFWTAVHFFSTCQVLKASGVGSGEGPAGPGPPLIFNQNEPKRAEKHFSETASPPLSQDLDDRPRHPPHLSSLVNVGKITLNARRKSRRNRILARARQRFEIARSFSLYSQNLKVYPVRASAVVEIFSLSVISSVDPTKLII